MSLAVTEVPTPEQFLMVTGEGAEQASQRPPRGTAPHSSPGELTLARLHSQTSRSITFCCLLTRYFGRKSTAPLMGSACGSPGEGTCLPAAYRTRGERQGFAKPSNHCRISQQEQRLHVTTERFSTLELLLCTSTSHQALPFSKPPGTQAPTTRGGPASQQRGTNNPHSGLKVTKSGSTPQSIWQKKKIP